ncbi:MAG: hypothetical protein Q7K11_01300 [Candidatus Berkelbacteria bacterium]|nr:hypothetical protein [Candidatus Berkelbacteria bacterium]
MGRFSDGTLVKLEVEGKTYFGVVCSEIPGSSVCDSSETPVHLISERGPGIYQGMPTTELSKVDAPPDELVLTADHINNVCKIGCGEATCKYLVVSDGFQCAKGSRISMVWGIEFKNDMKSKGDNCPGRMGSASP